MPSVWRELKYALTVSEGIEPDGRGNAPDADFAFKSTSLQKRIDSKAAGSL